MPLYPLDLRRHAALLICAMIHTAPLMAQSDDIVVTALGRSETTQRAPDTITAFDNVLLRERRLQSLDDVLGATPGVLLIAGDQDPGVNLITIRGLSSNRGQEPSVGFVVDGQSLPESELFTLRPYDLAQVEILKGPQGALFGRSASGGVIVMTSKAPERDTGGFAEIGYGNGNSLTSEAALNFTLGEKLAARLSFSSLDSKGTQRNSTTRTLVDDFASRNVRLQMKLDVSDDVSLLLRGGHAHEDAGAANIIMGEFTRSSGGRLDPARFVDPYGDFPGRASRSWWGVASTLNARLANDDRLRVNVAWDRYSKDFIEEFDFLPFKPITFLGEPFYPDGVQPIRQPVEMRALTLDARLTSADDRRLRYIVGVFAQRVTRDRIDDFEGFFLPPFAYRNRSRQLGLYGQLQTDITPALEISAALRHDRDNRRQSLRDAAGTLLDERENIFTAWQPKLSLAWRPLPSVTAYATGSIGFKSGGFNPLPVPSDPVYALTFPAERTRGVETGLKLKLANWRFALAGYATRLDNFQNTVFLTNNIVFSVPRVVIKGVEASASGALGAGFSLEASAVYTDARVRDYRAPNPTPEPGEPDTLDYRGKRLVNSPDYTAMLGLRWQRDFGEMTLTARADYTRVGSIHYELDNILTAPPHDFVDAQMTLHYGRFSGQLWVKNLSDSRWATSAYGQQQLAFLLYLGPGGPYDSYTVNQGRRWGASLRMEF